MVSLMTTAMILDYVVAAVTRGVLVVVVLFVEVAYMYVRYKS